jgi:hypothetical protein
VRQSGGQPASHGRITKAGQAHARGMLVEAAWSACKAAGPLRAFYQRVQVWRGMQVAVVATARKLTVRCWHLIIKGEDYAYAQPSLAAHKRRKLELRAGAPAARGQKGKAAGYSLKAVRAAERDLVAQAEKAYQVTDRERGERQQLLLGVLEHGLDLGELAAQHGCDGSVLLAHRMRVGHHLRVRLGHGDTGPALSPRRRSVSLDAPSKCAVNAGRNARMPL